MSPHCLILYAGCALNYCKVIDDFIAKTKDLQKFELTKEDWSAIQLVCHWLKAFCSATTQLSTTKWSMLSSTQAIICGLQESQVGNGMGLQNLCGSWVWVVMGRVFPTHEQQNDEPNGYVCIE